MYDFPAFRQQINEDGNVILQMRKELIQILQHYTSQQFRAGSVSQQAFANKPAPKFILNTLCTAIACFTIHTHQQWPNLFGELIQYFSNDIEQAFCLLQILRYISIDCDNESIVIEESLRTSYYNYIDTAVRNQIFKGILEFWAQNVPQLLQNQNIPP